MIDYLITFNRSDTGAVDTARIKRGTMKEAVKALVENAQKKEITISDISARVKLATRECKGVQKFCQECLLEPAGYGFNNEWFCKKCITNENND